MYASFPFWVAFDQTIKFGPFRKLTQYNKWHCFTFYITTGGGSKKRVRLVSLIRLLSEHHLLFSIALNTHCVEHAQTEYVMYCHSLWSGTPDRFNTFEHSWEYLSKCKHYCYLPKHQGTFQRSMNDYIITLITLLSNVNHLEMRECV